MLWLSKQITISRKKHFKTEKKIMKTLNNDKELEITSYETKEKTNWLKVVVKVIRLYKKVFKVPNSFRIIKISDKIVVDGLILDGIVIGDAVLNANITTITKNYNGRRVISVHSDIKSECLRGFKG